MDFFDSFLSFVFIISIFSFISTYTSPSVLLFLMYSLTPLYYISIFTSSSSFSFFLLLTQRKIKIPTTMAIIHPTPIINSTHHFRVLLSELAHEFGPEQFAQFAGQLMHVPFSK